MFTITRINHMVVIIKGLINQFFYFEVYIIYNLIINDKELYSYFIIYDL